MSLKCPNCHRVISRWQFIGFFRLFSISCPRCRVLLALDGRGRAAFIGSILASLALVAVLAQFIDQEAALLAVVVAGFALGSYAATKFGRLGISAENSGKKDGG